MKKFSNLCFLFILILVSCSQPADEAVEYVDVDGKKIPILNIGLVDEDPTIVGLSAIFEDVDIIPLETDEKCMIMNWMTGLSPNSLYLATQTGGLGPIRLMEFDFEGKYLCDFGGGGKGPGEHTGYSLEGIRYYPESNIVLAEFFGTGMENHLFTPEAKFLGEVKNPFELAPGMMGMLGENLFFTKGSVSGKTHYRRDSVLIEWHDKDGRILKSVQRTNYPPDNTGFSPSGWGKSFYRFGKDWHMYSPGNDTIYKISKQDIEPIGIFEFGEKRAQLNEIVDPKEVIGRFTIEVFAENAGYWILQKKVYTKCDMTEYRPGQWGGEVNFDYSIIVVRKDDSKAWNIKFEDDLLGLIDWEYMEYMLQWDDSGRFYIVVGAMYLIEKIDEGLKKGTLPEAGIEKVKDLRSKLDENSNPVLFMFKERKKYKLD